MENEHDFLTEIRHDWPQDNLVALQETLKLAYQAVETKTDILADAAFDTPNRVFVMGILRWFLVDSYLERACRVGKFKGIKAVWVKLAEGSGGIAALELRGKFTALSAHHLQHPDDPPRDSNLRFEKRLSNYQNPSLPCPDFQNEAESDPSLINLMLVHGDKFAEFAFLRIYNNPQNMRGYLQASENLMNILTLIPPIEVEPISEPSIDLKPHLKKDTEDNAAI